MLNVCSILVSSFIFAAMCVKSCIVCNPCGDISARMICIKIRRIKNASEFGVIRSVMICLVKVFYHLFCCVSFFLKFGVRQSGDHAVSCQDCLVFQAAVIYFSIRICIFSFFECRLKGGFPGVKLYDGGQISI